MKLDWERLLCSDALMERSPLSDLDKRSPFDSDRDRIIFSTPLRRLQDKAQLFPLESNDFIRTRLTHSLEVSNIAKSLGISVASKLSENSDKYGWKKEYEKDFVTILECAGLVHDFGNPPFGHIAEKYIEETIKEKCKFPFCKNDILYTDCIKFDGNAQTFRILTHLQCIKDFAGLHLTKACLATTLKYPVSSSEFDKESEDIRLKKIGIFYSERKEAEDVLKSCGLDFGIRHPLTFLLEAADDIAYSVSDIEDGAKKGILNLEKIKQFIDKRKDGDEVINNVIKKIEGIENDKSFLSSEKKIQMLRIKIQGLMFNIVINNFIKNYDLIMTGKYDKDIILSSDGGMLRTVLKDMSKTYLMDNSEVLLKESMGKKIIKSLMQLFIEGFHLKDGNFQKIITNDFKFDKNVVDPHILSLVSVDYQTVYLNTLGELGVTNLKKLKYYYTLRLITDYISGMTDNYCVWLYRKLNGLSI